MVSFPTLIKKNLVEFMNNKVFDDVIFILSASKN